jgi:hypothetical protein
MTSLENTQVLPLRLTEDGTIRVADSRVSLESVVHHYKLGATAEQIAQKFPALSTSCGFLVQPRPIKRACVAADSNSGQTTDAPEIFLSTRD